MGNAQTVNDQKMKRLFLLMAGVVIAITAGCLLWIS
jgi:hypothetical protein